MEQNPFQGRNTLQGAEVLTKKTPRWVSMCNEPSSTLEDKTLQGADGVKNKKPIRVSCFLAPRRGLEPRT